MTKNKSKPMAVLGVAILSTISSQAQTSANSAGGDATGSGGTVAYSIGQVVYTSNISGTTSIAQGVQQGYDITTVGISADEKNISLTVFPNPTTEDLKLKITDTLGENLSYTLTDAQGKQLKTGAIKENETHIEMKALANGIYFMQVNETTKNLKTFKVVKNQ